MARVSQKLRRPRGVVPGFYAKLRGLGSAVENALLIAACVIHFGGLLWFLKILIPKRHGR
jgi:hypothetical protein